MVIKLSIKGSDKVFNVGEYYRYPTLKNDIETLEFYADGEYTEQREFLKVVKSTFGHLTPPIVNINLSADGVNYSGDMVLVGYSLAR